MDSVSLRNRKDGEEVELVLSSMEVGGAKDPMVATRSSLCLLAGEPEGAGTVRRGTEGRGTPARERSTRTGEESESSKTRLGRREGCHIYMYIQWEPIVHTCTN